jgi:hypothetical protein
MALDKPRKGAEKSLREQYKRAPASALEFMIEYRDR